MSLIRLLLLLVFVGGSREAEENTLESPRCCNGQPAQVVSVEFASQIVENEYIVTFNGYYKNKARAGYINSALNGSGVKNWTIVERQNPASDFPSDFDVVLIEDTEKLHGLDALNHHPLVKHVSSQRMVHRTLKFLNVSDPIAGNTRKISKRSWARNPLYQGDRHTSRKLLRTVPRQISSVLQADVLWNMGITGKGVKVAVFDTGLAKTHPHFKRIKERTNWTNEKTLEDKLGHGTFVAGVIAASKECLGLAPDAELHIFRVFTKKQVSYTSWFLDAFNYAILKKVMLVMFCM